MKENIAEMTSKKTGFEDAIMQTGYGRFNIEVLLASGGCLMVVIIETMAMMMIVPASQCDLDLELSTKGIMNAISFLGVVSSSHMWGFIADTKGRRNVLILSMLSSFITSMISSIIPWAWLFILIRFINGFFVGGASAVVYAYVGEFHDRIYRPKVVSWIATFVAIGNMMIPGLAWAVLPLDFSIPIPQLELDFKPWRLLVICYGAPSLLFALWLYKLPESPKYLMSQGRKEDALRILQTIYSQNSGRPKSDFPITEIIWEEQSASIEDRSRNIFVKMWQQTIPLFKRGLATKTFMVCLLQFGAFFSSSMLMWYPELMNRITFYTKANPGADLFLCNAVYYEFPNTTFVRKNIVIETSCTDTIETDVFLVALLVGATFAVIYLFIGAVINMVGAKNLLITFLIITTSCGIAAQHVAGSTTIETLVAIFLAEATCVGVINAVVVDLFPTNLRAMALSISLMAGRMGAVAGSNASGPLIFSICDYMFYCYGLDHLIMIITVLLLPSPPNSKKLIEPTV